MHKLLLCLFLSIGFFTNVCSQDLLKIPIPSETLFKKNKRHDFTISPNGKLYAEIKINNKEREILIVDIDNYKLQHRIPLGRTMINNLYWLNSKRLIYESFGVIHAIDIDGTNESVLVSGFRETSDDPYGVLSKNRRFNSLVSLYPQNKNEILVETFDLSGFASIMRVNVFTGNKIIVLNGKRYKVNKWLVDKEGNPKLAVRYNDEGFNLLVKNKDKDRWDQCIINIEGKEIPLQVKAESYLSQNLNFEGFANDRDVIYLTSNVGSDRRELLEYSIKENKVLKVLLKDDVCDVSDPHGQESLLINDFKKGDLLGIRYESMHPKFKWISEDFKKVHDSINLKYPRFINEIIDYDDQKHRFLIHQWSDVNLGNIGVYDYTDGSYAVMFHFNDELNKYSLSRTHAIKAKARDGYEVPCYLNLPVKPIAGQKTPLIVFPHGGPWSRDYWGLDKDVNYFTSRGFAVLKVNFRGSTGFGKKHVNAGINGLDKVMIDDIADAANAILAKHETIDDQRVYVYGYSYGGYATYMSLIKYPNLFTAGVAIAAPSDIKVWMKQRKKKKQRFAFQFWNAALGTRNSKYWNSISPITYVEEMNKPLLIFHGKHDGVVEVEQAKAMEEQLKKHDKKVKLEILHNEGHSINDGNTRGYILERIDNFFKQNK